jgi:hypothetical protein
VLVKMVKKFVLEQNYGDIMNFSGDNPEFPNTFGFQNDPKMTAQLKQMPVTHELPIIK